MNDKLEGRILFILQFTDENPAHRVPSPNGQAPQKPGINVPAFVKDWQTASDKAAEYIKAYPATPEGKNNPDVQLELRTISLGGTILT